MNGTRSRSASEPISCGAAIPASARRSAPTGWPSQHAADGLAQPLELERAQLARAASVSTGSQICGLSRHAGGIPVSLEVVRPAPG